MAIASRSLLMVCFVLWPLLAWAATGGSTWLTADQLGQRLMLQERYLEAAESFADPMHKGVAFYRGGAFDKAAAVFGRINTAEAHYNRGNALIFLGSYESAIEAYGTALQLQPGWADAEENRALAEARLAALAPPDSDSGGTGGMLGADEIVFDDTGRANQGGTEVETDDGVGMSDEEMRQVWLRRVENKPADFLRARFSYQLYRQQQLDNPQQPSGGASE